jgi:hypothetical protein
MNRPKRKSVGPDDDDRHFLFRMSLHDPHGIGVHVRRAADPWDRQWTPELVAEEAQRLAAQIAEIGLA